MRRPNCRAVFACIPGGFSVTVSGHTSSFPRWGSVTIAPQDRLETVLPGQAPSATLQAQLVRGDAHLQRTIP